MTKLEQEQFEKQVYENQESLLKIMQENIELKKQIKKLREYVESINGNFWMATSVKKELLEILDKGDKNDN